jgi:hypothetical protein
LEASEASCSAHFSWYSWNKIEIWWDNAASSDKSIVDRPNMMFRTSLVPHCIVLLKWVWNTPQILMGWTTIHRDGKLLSSTCPTFDV